MNNEKKFTSEEMKKAEKLRPDGTRRPEGDEKLHKGGSMGAEKETTLEEDNEFLRTHQQGQTNQGGRGFGMRGPGGPGGPGPHGRNSMIREKPKNMWKTLKRLFGYIGKSRFALIALLSLTVVTTALNLAGPTLQGSAINAIFYKTVDGEYIFNAELLFKTLTLMGIVYLANSGVTYVVALVSAKLSQNTVYTMRSDLFRRISYLPIRFTDTHQHGDIMSRMTNDVENISNAISSSVSSLFSGVITVIGTVIIMLCYSWQMTLIAMVTIPITMLVSVLMAKVMRKLFVKQQRLLGALNGQVEESVTGYRTIVAYGRERNAQSLFGGIAKEYKKTSIRSGALSGLMGPMMNVINNIGFLLIAISGGYFAITGRILVGTIQVFIQYSKQFSRPINELANQYSSLMTAIAGAERVFEIMDAPGEKEEKGEDIDVSSVKGDLSFEHIFFSYKPGEPVIKDFNLKVKAGQRIAIVGKTGSGKTTIVNLLTRFYDCDSGTISLDGRNINSISKDSLRSAIAIVLQDTVLFSDTVGANIRYGKQNASEDEVRSAAATANADVFIERLPEGYETQLTESGDNLSQGQRQLISIARAVLADPKILILDEATSSVDTRTEMQIQSAMLSLMENRTSLVIAHRLSTIRDADMIIVLDDGHIVEQGDHESLLVQKGVYYNLYQTQFAGMAT